ncbi:MAG: glycoside hydrolase family 9 protein [Lachnospiraceae bacterium]
MKKGKVAIRKRIGAWLLALVMVASLVTVPAKTVEAETVSNATDSSKPVYVEFILDSKNSTENYNQYDMKLYNNSENTICDWTITVQFASDPGWNAGWNGASYDSESKTMTIQTYGESTWDNATIYTGEYGSGAGFQVKAGALGSATVTVTYSTGESASGPSTSGGSSGGENSDWEVEDETVKLSYTHEDQYSSYIEYKFTVQNTGSSAVSGDLVITFDQTREKNWWTSDYTIGLSGNTLTISNLNVPANGSVGSIQVQLKPLGANITSVTFAGKKIAASGATAGSGGSSGGSLTDTTTDLNLDIDYNYAKLLQESLYFYDANMCGPNVGETTGLDWRDDCHTADQTVTYNGKPIDVSGGFHDAGDHVKFGLPQGYSATVLALSYYEFKEAFDELGQTAHYQKIMDYFCDYFVNCTVYTDDNTSVEAFCYQVGEGNSDHGYWGAPETQTTDRPAYFATASNPATDEVSVAIAALALHAKNFPTSTKSATYLKTAKDLFTFVKNNSNKGCATEGAGSFYSSSDWKDDYCAAAAALWVATGKTSGSEYETELNSYYTSGNIKTGWVLTWDNTWAVASVLKEDWNTVKTFASYGNTNTAQGFKLVDGWGSARYNTTLQFLGLAYDKGNDKFSTENGDFGSWATGQMNYLLGNNNNKRCFVVGYNENSSQYPHHRAASRSSSASETNSEHYTLLGALVGGPSDANDTYADDQADYNCNEVALDYNAGFVGAAAGLYLLHKNNTEINKDLATESELSAIGVKTYYSATPAVDATGVTVDANSIPENLAVGETANLTATVAPVGASQTVTWDSDNTDVATVSSKGVVTAVAPGSATITVTTADGNFTDTCNITVTKKTITSITFPTVSGSVTAGTALKDVTLSKTSDDYGTFAWKTPETTVTGAMTGADVVYTLKDSANVEIASTVDGVNEAGTTVTRTVAFTVSKVTPTVTVPDSIKTVVAGTKLSDISLTGCTASVSGSFTWKETNKELTYADNNKEYTIVFTPADAASYNTVETKITLTVNKKTYAKPPAAPTLAGKTADSVTLEEYSGDGTVQYGYKSGTGTYTWQDTAVFTNLSPYTTYTFAMQFAGNDIYEASGAGDGLEVTTYYAEADCLKVNLSELTDKYVEAHNGTISYDSETNTLTLSEDATYTITGSNPDVIIQCGKATVILDDATFKKLEATGDVVIQLEDDNVISSGITGTGTVTIENVNNTSAGSLTVTGSDKAAIEADKIVINGGQITATGIGTNPAIKAGTEIDLYGGALTANGAENTITPIVVDGTGKIVLDGCQVQSGAATVYSPDPVDKDGNNVTLRTITYKDGDTTLHTYTAKNGATITLDNLAAKTGYKADGWKGEGTTDVLAPGTEVQVEDDITYVAVYTEITGEIAIEAEAADPLTVGYSSDTGVKVTVTNGTNVTIDKITLALDSDEYFTLSDSSISSLESEASQAVYVKLKNGMGVNEAGYTVTVTASCKEADSKNAIVTRQVVKKTLAAPTSVPEVASKTASSVTLTPVEGAEYGIKNGSVYDWQDSNVFTDLVSYTTYTFVFRYKEIDDTAASPASDEVTVTTYMSDTEKYIVDVSKVDNAEYVEAHNGTISVTDNVLTLEGEGTYTITGTNESLTIDAEENVTIILDDAVIKNITGEKDVTIQLKGESTIESTDDSQSAVDVTGKVTITTDTDTTGSVTIQGGNNAAGITAGDIEIANGTVDVQGGSNAAGINTSGTVTITGGTVDVQGGSDAAGITADTVDITGGTVSVTGQGDKPAVDAETKNIDSGVNVEIKNGDDYTESNPGENPGEDPDNPGDNPGEDPEIPDPGEQKEPVKKVESVKISISSTSIMEDTTVTATVTVLPADATDKSVAWSSTDPTVATVSQAGVITAVSEGTTDIIATAKDGSNKSDKITITVVSNDDEDDEIKASAMVVTADVKNASDMPIKATMKLAPKKKMQLNVAFLPEEAEEEELTYTSSNTKIVKVDEDGEITAGAKAGTATITVSSENGLKKTFKVQVMQKAITKVKLKVSTKTVKVKKKLKVKVTLTPSKKQASDVVFWKSSNPDVATVTQAGVVKGIKKGKAKITAVAADGSGKKATLTITVK